MVEGLDGYSGISLEEGESRSSDSLLAGRVISIYIYSARLHNYYLEKLDKFQLDIFILSG